MKAVVTNRQIFFMLMLLLTCYNVITIPKDAVKASGTGAWFTLLMVASLVAIGVYFIASLGKKFEGKTVFEYSKLLVGKPLGYAISLFYTLYFLLVMALLCRMISEFIKGSLLPLTPVWVLVFLIVAFVLYMSYKGITNAGRLCEIYGVILIVTAFFIHTSMLIVGEFKYIQPFFETSQIKEYVLGMKSLIVPFLGVEILMLVPFGKANHKKGVLTAILAVLFVGLLYIMVVESSIMVVGINDIVKFDNSLLEALRETKLPETILLERPDLLFVIVGMIGIVAGLCVMFSATIETVAKFVPRVKKTVLFPAIGGVIFVTSTYVLDLDSSTLVFNTVIPICGVFTVFVIPITLFITAKVKKL